jgi:hypothetical protein
MKKLLLAGAAMLALSLPAHAAMFNILAPNPNSATGNFALAPLSGPFEDQVVFTVIGGPQFLTIANATNTFAGPNDMIQNWQASIWDSGLDQVVNTADDFILFGPQSASACILTPNCQFVGGSGILEHAGVFYAEFTGIGSGTSGYAGNISTFQVPGPIVGAGLPGLIAGALAFLGWRRRRQFGTA